MVSRNKNIFTIIVIWSILNVLSYGCDSSTDPIDSKQYVYGYAYLDSSITCSGMLVRIIQTNDSTYTDSNGKYKLFIQEPDTYTVVVSIEGYEPSFAIFSISEIQKYRISDLILNRSPCLSLDSIPPGYPLRVNFWSDDSYTIPVDRYIIGSTLYISAVEYYMPPYVTCASVQNDYDQDLIIVSSIGDKEKIPVHRILGSVPSQWRFAYLIESRGSQLPTSYDGIIEVEPSGGQIIAMYQSWWLRRYVCGSIDILPATLIDRGGADKIR